MNKSSLLSLLKFPFLSAGASSGDFPRLYSRRTVFSGAAGMTLPEMLVAMSMLVIFTGVVVMVMEFTNRFFVDVEGEKVQIEGTPDFVWGKGVLIEHAEIQIVMDSLVEVLSQSGISLSQIKTFSSVDSTAISSACVGPVEILDDDLRPYFAADIAAAWNLPISAVRLPRGYSLCLWSTNPPETSSSPGIYVLQALPDNLSASKLPTRRIFCRPRHLC